MENRARELLNLPVNDVLFERKKSKKFLNIGKRACTRNERETDETAKRRPASFLEFVSKISRSWNDQEQGSQ